MMSFRWVAGVLAIAAMPACSREKTGPAMTASTTAPASSASQVVGKAEIGKPAPDFVLKDLDGHDVRLSDSRGKITVLEWFNPRCPFVNMSHTKGSLKGEAARRVAEGVVWLGVDSAGPGKQGYDVDTIRAAVTRLGITNPILRDDTGVVGHAYGATNTPDMFVIDRNGTLVYAGAIDNSPDAEGLSPQGGPLVNYVDAALEDLTSGRPVHTPRTKPYGCGVKYSS